MHLLVYILQLILATGLWCNGLYVSSREPGDALYWFAKLVPEKWYGKPIIHCINCMASLHSVIIIHIFSLIDSQPLHYNKQFFIVWSLVTVFGAFINGVFFLIHEVMNIYVFRFHIEQNEKRRDSDV